MNLIYSLKRDVHHLKTLSVNSFELKGEVLFINSDFIEIGEIDFLVADGVIIEQREISDAEPPAFAANKTEPKSMMSRIRSLIKGE